MSLVFYDNYINNLAKSNEEYYREFAQEWVEKDWEDSTLIRTISEQIFPFEEVYNELEVQVDTVSDVTVNTTKIIGDYRSIQFKDCYHRNYRGQKYILDDDVYLCYDRIEPLSKIAKTKVIRCNNVFRWIDGNGKICEEPMFLGEQISSTNDLIDKDGTIPNARMIVLIQNNENTKDIKINQRFMVENSSAFKIEEINNFIREEDSGDRVTLIKIYLKRDAINSHDNVEENLCDYYDTKRNTLEIIPNEVEQSKGFEGTLSSIVRDVNGNVINIPLEWSTSDSSIVEIDNLGKYRLVGENGSMAVITCHTIDDNTVSDSIEIKISDTFLPEREIVVDPIISSLKQGQSQEFNCSLYINGERQSENVICEPNWVGENYTLEPTIDGYKLTNVKMSSEPLILTFKTNNILDKYEMIIRLRGIL